MNISHNIYSLGDLLMQHRHVEDKGIYFEDGSNQPDFLSYDQLINASMQIGDMLLANGVKMEDELILQINDNKLFISIFWACIFKRIIPVPITVGKQEDLRKKVLEVMKKLPNPHLISSPEHAAHLSEHIASTSQYALQELVGTVFTDLDRLNDFFDKRVNYEYTSSKNGFSQKLAFIQFSSGSTGSPKGVTLTHGNIIVNLKSLIERSVLTDKDIMLSWVPLTHDMGIVLAHFCCTAVGIDQYIIPTDFFRVKPLRWFDRVHQYRASLLYTNNFGLKYFLSSLDSSMKYDWDLSCVRLVYNAGEPVSSEICDQFVDQLSQYNLPENVLNPCYGMAEATVGITLHAPQEKIFKHHIDRKHTNLGDKIKHVEKSSGEQLTFVEVGPTISEVDLQIRDAHGQVLPPDHIGTINVKGPNITKGYYQDEEATRKSFDGNEWLNTGDLGFLTQKGRLVITGRAKNVIIINGQNYYPDDIERIVGKIDDLEKAVIAACGYQAKDLQEHLLIFVTHRGNAAKFAPIAKKVKRLVLQKLGLQPLHVIPIRRIPKTTSGKVQYFRLREQFANGAFDETLSLVEEDYEQSEVVINQKNIESILFSKIKYLYSNDDLDITESLVELENNSLLTIQLSTFINSRFEVKLPIRCFFKGNTIADIAKLILQEREQNEKIETRYKPTSFSRYPLSHAQKRLWIIHHSQDLVNTAYNNVLTFLIKGALDEQLLRKALIKLAARHEILRTQFHFDHDPFQHILAPDASNILFRAMDVEGQKKDQFIDELVLEERDHQFDFVNEALLRIHLIRIDAEENVMVFNIHHIISDAWSVRIMLEELSTLYHSLLLKIPDTLASKRYQYKDYTIWHNEWIASDEGKRAAQYWRNKLEGFVAYQDFNGKEIRPVQKSFEGRTISRSIKGALYHRLKENCDKSGTTAFMFLLATTKILLSKYLNSQDITIGTPMYARPGLVDEEELGFFINTLPLRSQLDEEEPFNSFLQKVRATCLEAFEHQQYPLDLILNELNVPRESSRSPLFDVLVEFNHSHLKPEHCLRLEGTSISNLKIDNRFSLYDLSFEFDQSQDELSLNLNYNTDLYSDKEVKRLADNFFTLLNNILEKPDRLLHQYSYFSEEEHERILGLSTGQHKTYDLSSSYVDYLKKRVSLSGNDIALVHNDESYTLLELDRASNKIAHYLNDKYSLGAGERVGVLLERSKEFICWVLGIWKAGGAYVPLDPSLPPERIRHMVDIASMKCIVTAKSFPGLVSDERQILVEEQSQEIEYYSDIYSLESPSSEDLAYVLFTSGSTGTPKGVMIEHKGMVNHMLVMRDYLNIDDQTRIAQNASQSFDISVWQLFTTFITGGKVFLYDKKLLLDTAAFATRIQQDQISILELVPSYLGMILEDHLIEKEGWHALEHLLVTGEEVKTQMIQRTLAALHESTRLHNAYGPAEASDDVTLYHISDIPSKWVSVGMPVANTNVYILDEYNNLCHDWVKGEICIAGVGVGQGYINDKAMTEASFVNNPFEDEGRLYRTGDMGFRNEQGEIFFTARKDHQVKVNGQRIELGEIEHTLRKVKNVKDAVVMVMDQNGDPQIVAFVSGIELSDQLALSVEMEEKLPVYMRPSYFITLDQIPLNDNGKVDRKALSELAVLQISDSSAIEKSDENELDEQLAKLWNLVLRTDQDLDRNSNFFELGGHSLLAIRLAHLIGQHFNVKVTLSTLFRKHQLGSQADYIRDNMFSTDKDIPILNEQEYYDISIEQQRFLVADELSRKTYTNNAVGGVWLYGEVDKEKLRHAAELLVHRHEILRSTIIQVDQEYKFQVNDRCLFDFMVSDLTSDPDALGALAKNEAEYTFDLEQLPLIRWHLVDVKDQKSALLVTMHHVMADGWSVVVLFRDLLRIYDALHKDQEGLLPARLTTQYKDYAAWFNKKSNGLHVQGTFWEKYLQLPLPELNMPLDHPRHASRLNSARNIVFKVTPDKLNALKEMAAKAHLTPFAFMLAFIKIVLFKYTRTSDQLIALPVAGREHPQLLDQVGLYMKILFLRSNLSEEMDFEALVRDLYGNMLKALDQPFSYDYFTDSLKLSRPSRHGLYDVMVMHQAVDLGDQMDHLEVAPYIERMFDDKIDCDLRFDFIEYRDDLTVAINYDATLFEAAKIEVLKHYLVNVMDFVLVHGMKVPLSEINPEYHPEAGNENVNLMVNSEVFTEDFNL